MVQAMQKPTRQRAQTAKERPVIFGPESIRAILSGSKTQTRRVISPQPVHDERLNVWQFSASLRASEQGDYFDDKNDFPESWLNFCPYGKPCDRLWVRETWQYVGPGSGCCDSCDDEALANPANHSIGNVWYRADPKDYGITWRPSIFMLRWASRITLQIESIRVERLQEISEDDAKAEGLLEWKLDDMPAYEGARDSLHVTAVSAYASLWNSINLKRGYGWSLNPWVWVVTFSQVK